jgi:hypothetical protein
MRFVANVAGKRARKILLDNVDNLSVDVRVIVVKSMYIARDCWPQDLSAPFVEILAGKTRDQSEKVRALCGEPDRSVHTSIVAQEDPLASETRSLPQILDDRDTIGLLRHIQTSRTKPELMGHMQAVIDCLVRDLNEEDCLDSAVELFQTVCDNFGGILHSFLPQLILDLPEDDRAGERCLESLEKSFGQVPMAKLLRKSRTGYAMRYLLKVAEKCATDVDFQCHAILNVILNGFYERFRNIIIFLLKRIYPMDPRKCEALFSAIPITERNDLVEEIREQIPPLYRVFTRDNELALGEKIVQEIRKAKQGQSIDFELIKSVREQNSSDLLLAIAALRESLEFDDKFVPYLVKCTANKDIGVVGAASIALEKCENHPKCSTLIADSFVATNAALKAFGRSLSFAELRDAKAALETLQPHLSEAVDDPSLKYSALFVLAKASISFGDEYRSFIGNLSSVNAKLLNLMISTERRNDALV